MSRRRDNLGGTHRILSVLVDLRVERGEIKIFYLLSLAVPDLHYVVTLVS